MIVSTSIPREDIKSINSVNDLVGGDAKQNHFQKLASDFASVMQDVDSKSNAVIAGDADPHTLVEALAQSKVAVDTAVTVRNKVVEAYRESCACRYER